LGGGKKEPLKTRGWDVRTKEGGTEFSDKHMREKRVMPSRKIILGQNRATVAEYNQSVKSRKRWVCFSWGVEEKEEENGALMTNQNTWEQGKAV